MTPTEPRSSPNWPARARDKTPTRREVDPTSPPTPGAESSGTESTPAYTRYVLGLLFATTTVSMLDRQILTILVQPIQNELGISDTAMGLLTGMSFALLYAAASLPIARWADRGIRRSIIAMGLFTWSSLTIVMGLAESFVHLFAARMALGIAQTTGGAPVQSLLSDYFPPERRAGAIGILAIGGGVGMALALLVGGWANELFGWRMALFVAGVPGLFLSLLVRLGVREPRRGAAESGYVDEKPYSVRETLAFLGGLRSFRHILASAALHAFAGLGASVWLPTFLYRVHDLGTGAIGTWIAAVMGVGMIGTYLGGVLSDRLGRSDPRWYMWIPALATLAGVPFSAAFLLWGEMPQGFAFYAVAAFFGGMWTAPSFAMVQGLSKVSMRATAAALMSLTLNLTGLGLGPLAVGAISDSLAGDLGNESLRYALLFLLVTHFWAITHHILAARTLRQDLSARGQDSKGVDTAPTTT